MAISPTEAREGAIEDRTIPVEDALRLIAMVRELEQGPGEQRTIAAERSYDLPGSKPHTMAAPITDSGVGVHGEQVVRLDHQGLFGGSFAKITIKADRSAGLWFSKSGFRSQTVLPGASGISGVETMIAGMKRRAARSRRHAPRG